MNTKNLWVAVLSGAVLTTLISNLPFIDLINCALFAGFWASAIFAVWLYRRLNGTLTVSEGVAVGVLTGVCAGVLGFALSFLGLAGFQRLVNELSLILPPAEIQKMANTSAGEILAFNLVGVSFNVLFGAIGGWIGGVILRTEREKRKVAAQI